MASGDTKTNQYLDIAAHGTRADLQRGCCNTRTQDLIMDVAERIITEEETRAREDQILQGEIDEIRNNPDVADIVPTYAALQNYDTSTLTDKDVIRVLTDETHDGASTYYRWSTSTETFTYVGEAGDYYTKSQMDTLLDEKQDELTAGENITIEDESGALVISAQSKEYTAGDGINISAQDVISATNTGKAKVLTTSDYNWNYTTKTTENPNCVALWLLEPGLYTKNYNYNAPPVVYVTSTTQGQPADYGYMVFNTKDNSFRQIACLSWDSNTFTGGYKTWFYTYRVDAATGGGIEGGTFVTSKQVADNLTTTSGTRVLSAKQGKVLKDLIDSIAIRGAGAPTASTVGEVGQLYEDGTNGALYQLKSIDITVTPNTYNWESVGGSSVNVVQTTGTSTTDVMSQNAVTSMIYSDPGTRRNVQITHTGASGTSYPSIRIGNSNNTAGARGIAIGGESGTTYRVRAGSDAIGIGAASADATGERSVAIGDGAKATQLYAIALGGSSRAEYEGGVAIGGYSVASQVGEVSIGNLTNTTAYALSKTYNNSGYRLLTGLYDGQSAHDAATKGQLDTAIINGGTTAPTTSTVGAVGTLYSYVDTTGTTPVPHLMVCTDTEEVSGGMVYTWTDLLSGVEQALHIINNGGN